MKRKVVVKETERKEGAQVSVRRNAALKVAAIGLGATATLATALKHNRNGQIQKTVESLQACLGSRTTAYLSGADNTLVVDSWVQGKAKPDPDPWNRLQSAYKATRCLVEAYDDTTARSWFLGMNPGFEDDSPAHVLRNNRDPRVLGEVVLAAREFAET